MAMGREIRIRRAMEAISHCEHIIRDMRPDRTWDQVHAAVNAAFPANPVSREKLLRSVHSLVDEGLMPAHLLVSAGKW